MKKAIIMILFIAVHTALQSQENYERIKITPDLELIKISQNAYIHVSYDDVPAYGRVGANGLIYINGNEAFLFDSPWNDSLTMKLVTYLENHMHLQITRVCTKSFS